MGLGIVLLRGGLGPAPQAHGAEPVIAAVSQHAQSDPYQAIDELEALRPIGSLGLDVRPPAGELPPDTAAERFAQVELWEGAALRAALPTQYAWTATGLCHQPLYFEEPNLERYGYSLGVLQPALSGAHFFGTLPILPYLMTARPHPECNYTYGWPRPGSDVPLRRQRLPRSAPGALVQGAVITGLIFVIP